MDGWNGDRLFPTVNNRNLLPGSALLSPSDSYGLFHVTSAPVIGKHFQVNPNNLTTNANGIHSNPFDLLPVTGRFHGGGGGGNNPFAISPVAGGGGGGGNIHPAQFGIKRYPNSSLVNDSFEFLGDATADSNFRIGVRSLMTDRIPSAAGYKTRDGALSLHELEHALRETSNFNLNFSSRNNGYSRLGSSNNNNINLNLQPPSINRSPRQPQPQVMNFSTLEDLRGKVLLVIKDQQSCRFLQQKLEEGKPEEVEMIFSEVKNCVRELMIDQSGNYLIQKLFQVCNAPQMSELLVSTVRDDRQLVAVCLDMHGTRAMQTMLQHLTTMEQRALVVSVLRRITVTLTKSVNGHHVIQHCVKFFSDEEKKPILSVIADNCLDIATDKSGCCVLQHCVENADGQSRERLVAEITANSIVLSEHPYGNYVVQNILGLKIPHVTSEILKQLQGSFVSLSMNKYGSNVVEKCLKESENEQAMQVVEEIISSPNFLMLLQDQYGNYVAQSALAICKGSTRHAMVNLINMHYNYLHSHPYGKRVLAKTRGNKQQLHG
ncbi:PREDICTED: pumilio homolog 12-like [Ipomoea nil]|uniref:pumilio homolog 12-like n=1 Tax=Ipomoea nil TaxID=35883 RepID=UPI0009009077|nr:PREDICTED: pumilio homolog 12-like [Ipomoea nil]